MENLDSINIIKTSCPQDGNCSLSFTLNTAIDLKKDEFGFHYIQKIESASSLIVFEYQRRTDTNAVDGQYIERIYFELPQQPKPLHLKDRDLNHVNLLFERLCYCKDATGVYKINEGTLFLPPLGENCFYLKLSFKTTEVPHILSTLEEILVLK